MNKFFTKLIPETSVEVTEEYDGLVLIATLIKFTIDGEEYQAEQGMTWAQWCESDYNSLGVYVNGNYVVGTTSGYYICSYPDTSWKVNKTNAIVEGDKYYLTNTPHSTGGSAN